MKSDVVQQVVRVTTIIKGKTSSHRILFIKKVYILKTHLSAKISAIKNVEVTVSLLDELQNASMHSPQLRTLK